MILQRVIFNIVNFGKWKNLYNSEMTPIVKSSSRPKWFLYNLMITTWIDYWFCYFSGNDYDVATFIIIDQCITVSGIFWVLHSLSTKKRMCTILQWRYHTATADCKRISICGRRRLNISKTLSIDKSSGKALYWFYRWVFVTGSMISYLICFIFRI